MKRLIASAALAASASIGALAAAPPASAQIAPYGVKALGVDFTPQAAGLMELNAYVYGYSFGAWVTCSEMGTGANPTQFGDCYSLIGPWESVFFPIIEYYTHWGFTVEFQYSVPYNQYTGYVAF